MAGKYIGFLARILRMDKSLDFWDFSRDFTERSVAYRTRSAYDGF